MHPELHILGRSISSYQFVYVIAIMVVGTLGYVRLRLGRGEIDATVQGRRLVIVVACALIGTHLISVLPSAIASYQQKQIVWAGRSNYIGTLLGGIAGAAIVHRGDRHALGRTLDLAGTPACLALAIGRIGCWSAGCCYGRETSASCGQWLRNHHGQWAWRYPTQMWSGLANLGMFVALMALEQWFRHARARGATWPRDGLLFQIYLVLAMVERFTLEWFRGDAVPVWGPLTWVHMLSCAVFATVTWQIGHALLAARRKVVAA